MSVVQYVFSTSFNEVSCKQYTKSTKKKTRGCCAECHLPKAQHLLSVACDEDEDEADSFLLLAQLFCDIRNLRLCITNFFHWTSEEVTQLLPNLISSLTESLLSIEEITDIMDIEQLIEAGQELVGYFEPSSEDDNLIEFINALDDVYYRLYYSVSLTWRATADPEADCPIPMPHVYFSKYLVDEATINGHLETVFDTNFTPEFKGHISRVFGLSESMSSNPLLSLHFSRWRESICLLHTLPGMVNTEMTRLLDMCVLPPLDEDADVSQHATMKPVGDPLIPPFLRVWNNSCRTWSCHLYAYATPSPEALDRLANHSPLIEIGAGTGYWAHMLRERHPKLELFAYDAAPPTHAESFEENTYHGRAKAWTTVSKGGVDKLSKHPNATLFLCYPPPDNDMALQALRSYKGDTVCYVGEYRGDTGTSKFEVMLDCSFQCVEHIPLPNWGDTCYELTIWSRIKLSVDSSVETLNHPARCTSCGKLKSKMYRCRLTYGVTFCSTECAINGRNRHLDELTFKYLFYNEVGTCASESSLSTRPSSKKKRRIDDNSSSSKGVTTQAPLFDVKSKFFTILKIKCPWL